MDATIDLKALLVEREDCDAGTVQKLREGLAQGGNQFKALREVTDALKKKLEAAPPPVAKKLHLKLGIADYFLGLMGAAVEQLRDEGLHIADIAVAEGLAQVQWPARKRCPRLALWVLGSRRAPAPTPGCRSRPRYRRCRHPGANKRSGRRENPGNRRW